MTRILLILLLSPILASCAENLESKFKSLDDASLIEITRALPASDRMGNYEGYAELARRQPEVKLWRDKRDFYSNSKTAESSRVIKENKGAVKPIIVKTRYCGLKTVELTGNVVQRIIHATGESTGGGKYWKYDGETLVHELLPDNKLPCSDQAPSREAIVDSLSSVFEANRKTYDFSRKEAKRFTAYTKTIMVEDNSCWTILDVSKSVERRGWYYIDCLSESQERRRWWLDKKMLRKNELGSPAEALGAIEARDMCSAALKYKVNNPSTYDPSLLTGTSSNVMEETGKNFVSIKFTAKNSFNLELEFDGICHFEDRGLKDVKIKERFE